MNIQFNNLSRLMLFKETPKSNIFYKKTKRLKKYSTLSAEHGVNHLNK